jgi:hypothetical protein
MTNEMKRVLIRPSKPGDMMKYRRPDGTEGFRQVPPGAMVEELVYLSPDEVMARQAEESAFAVKVASPQHRAEVVEQRAGEGLIRREDRERAIEKLPAGHPRRVAAEAVETAIAALGVRGDPEDTIPDGG